MRLLNWLFRDGMVTIEGLIIWRAVLAIAVLMVTILLMRWFLRRLARVFQRWGKALRERRTERLTARAAEIQEDTPYDLLFLHEKGFVRARGTGRSITEIYAQVENLIRKRLNIVIKPGTYFVSSGSHQNMVTRTEESFTIYPCTTRDLHIKASCINAEAPIPGGRDRFYGVAWVSDDLARFLEASKDADPMVVQAGVWALADGYSGHDVQSRLVAQDQFGHTRQAVSDAHIAEARRVLNRLGMRHNL